MVKRIWTERKDGGFVKASDYDAVAAELEECQEWRCRDMDINNVQVERIRALEAALRDAAMDCNSDHYMAIANDSALETACDHEWGPLSINNAESPFDPQKLYSYTKCVKCGLKMDDAKKIFASGPHTMKKETKGEQG